MSLNLAEIKGALAEQIADNVTGRQITVRPYRSKVAGPCVTMQVTDITYFETFGPNGYATVLLDLTVTVDGADPDSQEIAMDDFLSVGVGNNSSIADAINSDVALGGVVESCVCLEVGAPRDTASGYESVFPLKITTKKVGAQV